MGKKIILTITFLFIIYATNFINCSYWNQTLGGRLSYFLYLFIGYLALKDNTRKHRLPLKNIITLLFFIPLLCIITKIFYYEESIYDEKIILFSGLTFLFFYIFYKYHITEKDIIKILTIFGLIVFIIQVYQQILPSKAIFGIYNENLGYETDNIASIRNNLYRFRLGTSLFTIFCTYYYWDRFRQSFNIKNLVLFIIFLTSIYLYMTRQLMISTIITLCFSIFYIRNLKIRISIIITIILLMIILFYYSDILFGALIEQTKEEANEENIRLLAFGFYWNKIIENPLTFILGSGHPESLNLWQNELKLWTSDIGIIGSMFHYGLLWIILYFYIIYTILKKYAKSIPLYIKLYILGTFINSILIFPYRDAKEYLIITIILYISSIYILKKKQICNKNPHIPR